MSAKNTVLPVQTTLQSRGRLLDLSSPIVMGILNATPDSFYNKGRDSSLDELLKAAETMLSEGATILDVGGASTRPGAQLIAADEELKRVMPLVEGILTRFPEAWLSIDTYNARTAKETVAAGVSIVNDVSSGSIDAAMIRTVAALNVPYIIMHMPGVPETMQKNIHYDDVVMDVRNYLAEKCRECHKAGITDVIVDPGFGFGKKQEHNFRLLKELHTFRVLGKPVLAGMSRKSMVWKTLGTDADSALNGTTALNMMALQQGASMLRVHDVKEAVEAVNLYQHIMLA
jgi:dihydropteroate synthase